ncbi:MAG TPA: hypothetical protein PK156_02000 [Polyangium sp.]|nr:hypothetical protein [Polyangium sp.]
MRKLLPVFMLAVLTGCTGSAATPTPNPQTPTNATNTNTSNGASSSGTNDKGSATTTEVKQDKPAASKPAYQKERLEEPPAVSVNVSALAAPPKGLAEAPKTCKAFVTRKPAAAPACKTRDEALAALDKALSESSPDKRDAQLAGLEKCEGLPAGMTRALRAEMAPLECGDALVEPLVSSPPAGIDGAMYATLRGLATASRIARTGSSAPKLAPPFERKKVEEFIAGPMKEWMSSQAVAIEELSKEGLKLTSYARGIAAIEAGMAELRIVEAVRGAPVPAEFAKDTERANVYYAQLDQVLDPRKDRGRDATLVGLRDLGQAGVLHDARIDRARSLLSRLYGGRRIDALDALLFPALSKAEATTVQDRLAQKLPTFYAGILLPREGTKQAAFMRALLERGVPLGHRIALQDGELAPDIRRLYARARLEFGRTYLRAVDFDQTLALLAAIPESERTDEDKLIFALAEALRNGPEDAAVMVRNAPVPMLGMGDVKSLDALSTAQQKGPLAGFAAFDAALVKQITAPIGADAAYFRDIATRYRAAAGQLAEANHKKAAEERAKSAEATAAAIH